jgi:hypothetical protein
MSTTPGGPPGRSWRPSARDSVSLLAEADGNRTRLTELLGHVRFDDGAGCGCDLQNGLCQRCLTLPGAVRCSPSLYCLELLGVRPGLRPPRLLVWRSFGEGEVALPLDLLHVAECTYGPWETPR